MTIISAECEYSGSVMVREVLTGCEVLQQSQLVKDILVVVN